METEIVTLPKGIKDVNDLLVARKEKKWPELVNKSKEVVEYFFEVVEKKYDKNNPHGRKKIAYELLNIIKNISDPIEQGFWLKKLSNLVEAEEEKLTQILENVKNKEPILAKKSSNFDDKKADSANFKKLKIDALQERLLGVFSLFQEIFIKKIDEIEDVIFSGEYKEIWEKIINKEENLYRNKLNEFEAIVSYDFDEKIGLMENNSINPQKEWNFLIREIKKERNRMALEKIRWDIKKAQEIGDEEAEDLLLREFQKISLEKKAMDS